MKLSEAYEKYPKDPETYACCVFCHTAWLDDMPQYYALYCPRCCLVGGALYRGAKTPAEYGCTLDTGEAPVHVDDDPGAQAKNINKGLQAQ